MFKGPAQVSVQANNGGSSSSREQVLRGSSRGPEFIALAQTGLLHPGRGVNVKYSISDNRGAIRIESTSAGTRDSGKRIRCYACSHFGHVAEACTMVQN
jgi:hypothetical protein